MPRFSATEQVAPQLQGAGLLNQTLGLRFQQDANLRNLKLQHAGFNRQQYDMRIANIGRFFELRQQKKQQEEANDKSFFDKGGASVAGGVVGGLVGGPAGAALGSSIGAGTDIAAGSSNQPVSPITTSAASAYPSYSIDQGNQANAFANTLQLQGNVFDQQTALQGATITADTATQKAEHEHELQGTTTMFPPLSKSGT